MTAIAIAQSNSIAGMIRTWIVALDAETWPDHVSIPECLKSDQSGSLPTLGLSTRAHIAGTTNPAAIVIVKIAAGIIISRVAKIAAITPT